MRRYAAKPEGITRARRQKDKGCERGMEILTVQSMPRELTLDLVVEGRAARLFILLVGLKLSIGGSARWRRLGIGSGEGAEARLKRLFCPGTYFDSYPRQFSLWGMDGTGFVLRLRFGCDLVSRVIDYDVRLQLSMTSVFRYGVCFTEDATVIKFPRISAVFHHGRKSWE